MLLDSANEKEFPARNQKRCALLLRCGEVGYRPEPSLPVRERVGVRVWTFDRARPQSVSAPARAEPSRVSRWKPVSHSEWNTGPGIGYHADISQKHCLKLCSRRMERGGHGS